MIDIDDTKQMRFQIMKYCHQQLSEINQWSFKDFLDVHKRLCKEQPAED